jgi:integrase
MSYVIAAPEMVTAAATDLANIGSPISAAMRRRRSRRRACCPRPLMRCRRDKQGGKTKHADQTISIDRATVAALQSWREVQNRERDFFGTAYHPGGNVFTFEDGRPPHPDTIRQRFDRLAAAAGLSRITFHDLRHSYATGALKAGINPKVISARIGHANVGFILQTYAHVLRNDDRDAAEQAAAFLIGNTWGPTDEDKS